MDRTFEVTETFIREAHKAACREWKKKLEEAFPIFTPQSMWYSHKNYPNWLCHLNTDGSGYGFDIEGEWKDNFEDMNDYIKYNCTPATAEQVESALKGEAIKRGFIKGARFNSHVNKSDYEANLDEPNFWNKFSPLYKECRFNMSMYSSSGGVIYSNGKWATLISPPMVEGSWYKMPIDNLRYTLFRFNGNTSIHQIGFNAIEEWSEQLGLINIDRVEIASIDLVREALIKEAKKRGLVPGIYINSIWCEGMSIKKTPKYYSFNFISGLEMVEVGVCLTIFRDGVWAEPHVEETKAPAPTPEEITRVLDYLKSKQ